MVSVLDGISGDFLEFQDRDMDRRGSLEGVLWGFSLFCFLFFFFLFLQIVLIKVSQAKTAFHKPTNLPSCCLLAISYMYVPAMFLWNHLLIPIHPLPSPSIGHSQFINLLVPNFRFFLLIDSVLPCGGRGRCWSGIKGRKGKERKKKGYER